LFQESTACGTDLPWLVQRGNARVKNWWSTLTMRASAAEYRALPLRAHELLRDVPLYDVSSVDLPGGGSGRTVADIHALESATAPSHIATLLYGLRYFSRLGVRLGSRTVATEDSFLERLSERDRGDSEITPGTPDGHFWVLYQFPGEALRETRNRTVHGFICTALVSCPNGYHLYWGVYVRRVVAHATVPRRDRTISSPSVSSHASPHSSCMACRLRGHEPRRYRLMDDSAANEHPSNTHRAAGWRNTELRNQD
jgi:Protein of unknown function (DUF2867)